MRVLVVGTCHSAIRLRSLINRDPQLVLGESRGDFTVHLDEGPVADPILDGVDGELERRVLKHIGAITPAGRVLVLVKAGRITDDAQIAVTIPEHSEVTAHAVEHGIYRALLETVSVPRPWWRRVFAAMLMLLALLASPAFAQLQTGSPGGGGGGGSVTQGTTPWVISLSGGSLPAGTNAIGHVTFDNTTMAVTNAGTFAVQAAQAGTWNLGTLTSITNPVAVTGTFYQPTQPISAASLPLPSGASTEATLAAIKAQTDKLAFTGALLQTSASLVGGSGDGSILDGVNPLVKATVTGANALKVDGSAVTQPVSLATLPALTAGSALVGKFGIDQTTPGTTNKVTVGSDVVHTIVDSALALEATQLTGNTSIATAATNTRVRGTSAAAAMVIATDSDGTLLASNGSRVGWRVCNQSRSPMFVKFGAGASSFSFNIRVLPATCYGETSYTGQINAAWDVGADGFAMVSETQ